jgi:hypothetical protein
MYRNEKKDPNQEINQNLNQTSNEVDLSYREDPEYYQQMGMQSPMMYHPMMYHPMMHCCPMQYQCPMLMEFKEKEKFETDKEFIKFRGAEEDGGFRYPYYHHYYHPYFHPYSHHYYHPYFHHYRPFWM